VPRERLVGGKGAEYFLEDFRKLPLVVDILMDATTAEKDKEQD
jgi:hypothetical protein